MTVSFSSRRTVRTAGAVVACSAVAVAGGLTPAASAQPLLPNPSDFAGGLAARAWDAHVSVYSMTALLPVPLRDALRGATDGLINLLFPGVIAENERAIREAEQRRAEIAAEEARVARQREALNFDHSACPPSARACVDLGNQRAWLQQGGNPVMAPVPISSGRKGWETPRGTFAVNRKIKDEISYQFNNAPMPYATYFTNNGIAFHAGSPQVASHGCIHLNYPDAQRFFNELQYGDQVVVF